MIVSKRVGHDICVSWQWPFSQILKSQLMLETFETQAQTCQQSQMSRKKFWENAKSKKRSKHFTFLYRGWLRQGVGAAGRAGASPSLVTSFLSWEDFYNKPWTFISFYPLCLFRKYLLCLVTSTSAFYILNSSIGSKSSVIISFGISSV